MLHQQHKPKKRTLDGNNNPSVTDKLKMPGPVSLQELSTMKLWFPSGLKLEFNHSRAKNALRRGDNSENRLQDETEDQTKDKKDNPKNISTKRTRGRNWNVVIDEDGEKGKRMIRSRKNCSARLFHILLKNGWEKSKGIEKTCQLILTGFRNLFEVKWGSSIHFAQLIKLVFPVDQFDLRRQWPSNKSTFWTTARVSFNSSGMIFHIWSCTLLCHGNVAHSSYSTRKHFAKNHTSLLNLWSNEILGHVSESLSNSNGPSAPTKIGFGTFEVQENQIDKWATTKNWYGSSKILVCRNTKCEIDLNIEKYWDLHQQWNHQVPTFCQIQYVLLWDFVRFVTVWWTQEWLLVNTTEARHKRCLQGGSNFVLSCLLRTSRPFFDFHKTFAFSKVSFSFSSLALSLLEYNSTLRVT